MKKLKGVSSGAVVDHFPSPYAPGFEELRTKFKFQSLLQDYEELHKETEAKKKKLKMLKKKRSTLFTEVGFLRQRYDDLVQNQRQNLRLQKLVQSSKSSRKEKNYVRYDSTSLPPVPRFNPSHEGKIPNGNKMAMRRPTPLLDLNQKQKSNIGKEVHFRNSVNILPDLNLKERIDSAKEAGARTTFRVFDLNQISTEEEEVQAMGNTMRVEDSKINSSRAGSSEQQLNDIKLSACRSVGNGSSGSGKRKVSWQDQVALRV